MVHLAPFMCSCSEPQQLGQCSCFHLFVCSSVQVFMFWTPAAGVVITAVDDIHVFTHSCVHAFIRSRIHVLGSSSGYVTIKTAGDSGHVFKRSCLHTFMCYYVHVFICLCIHVFTRSFSSLRQPNHHHHNSWGRYLWVHGFMCLCVCLCSCIVVSPLWSSPSALFGPRCSSLC